MVPPGVELQDESIPEQIELFQNYPNPFNPATTISFYLPEPVEVSLSVFNVVGQPVTTLTKGVLNAGEHHFEWNATGYPSGMYIPTRGRYKSIDSKNDASQINKI